MAIIRLSLGKFIMFFNWLLTPRGIKRDPEAQAAINQVMPYGKYKWRQLLDLPEPYPHETHTMCRNR